MANATLRERFGIEEKNYPMASRIIAKTIKAGLVKPLDPTNRSGKQAKYVPLDDLGLRFLNSFLLPLKHTLIYDLYCERLSFGLLLAASHAPARHSGMLLAGIQPHGERWSGFRLLGTRGQVYTFDRTGLVDLPVSAGSCRPVLSNV